MRWTMKLSVAGGRLSVVIWVWLLHERSNPGLYPHREGWRFRSRKGNRTGGPTGQFDVGQMEETLVVWTKKIKKSKNNEKSCTVAI